MTENKGDLISREALLKRVDEERKYLIARGKLGAEHILVHNFRDLIDNAPTVEERPQGEWIEDDNHNIVCPFCGGHRRDCRIDHINFCNRCGADMRGGAK